MMTKEEKIAELENRVKYLESQLKEVQKVLAIICIDISPRLSAHVGEEGKRIVEGYRMNRKVWDE